MDDRDLEQRLRERLHARFDDRQPSADLRAGVSQAFATAPRRLGWASLRTARFQLGWSAVAVVAVAVIVILAANLRGTLGPAAPGTASPEATQAPDREFVVMSRSISNPTKAQGGLASDVLGARVRTLGFGTFSSATGYGIVFRLPPEGPSDDVIRAILRATGDVAFVPLPAEDYGDGRLVAELGKPLPKDEPALFGWEGIESAVLDTSGQTPGVTIILKPAITSAFGDYTTAHIGEQFALLVDGVVVIVPTIQSPILGGQVTVTPGLDSSDEFQVAAAVLVGGMLPIDWRDPVVPTIISEAEAVAEALRQFPADGYGQTGIDVIADDGRWRATWVISLNGVFPGECPLPGLSKPTNCPSADSIQVRLDAVSGDFISSEAPAP